MAELGIRYMYVVYATTQNDKHEFMHATGSEMLRYFLWQAEREKNANRKHN